MDTGGAVVAGADPEGNLAELEMAEELLPFVRHEREREPSYLPCCRRTISVIQMGANGDVQPGEVG